VFSFTKSKKNVDLCPFIRRICDLTTPNLTASAELARVENRYNRAIPTLVMPWVATLPVVDRYVFGLTKDIADRGIGVILSEPFDAGELLLGFWLDSDEMHEPWFFSGSTRRCSPIGGGFWLLGVELAEFANPILMKQHDRLMPLAAKLLPPDASIRE
jgi:hypothetical protein